MHNVFLLYMPPGNAQAMVNYENTIKGKVDLERLSRFLSPEMTSRLRSVFGQRRITVWGSETGSRNRGSFERMTPGDDVLIVEGGSIKLLGKIAAKVESSALSKELWPPLRGTGGTTWELIYFIANPKELDLPFTEFCRLMGYKPTYQLQGFTTVAADKLETFYQQYDDLYSVLLRTQMGEPVLTKTTETEPALVPEDLTESGEESDEERNPDLISDHVRMQWMLARLGRAAGEQVWSPPPDQTRIRKLYQFDEFETQFTSGIDLPHSYVENIDVVWKQEFRIGAAYEIENSTAIYSGLLRFADLNVITPNTTYPMFVVAPSHRKNLLYRQLGRLAFKELKLHRKVRFLSYEAVDEVAEFFKDHRSGLTVDTIVDRSELLFQ